MDRQKRKKTNVITVGLTVPRAVPPQLLPRRSPWPPSLLPSSTTIKPAGEDLSGGRQHIWDMFRWRQAAARPPAYIGVFFGSTSDGFSVFLDLLKKAARGDCCFSCLLSSNSACSLLFNNMAPNYCSGARLSITHVAQDAHLSQSVCSVLRWPLFTPSSSLCISCIYTCWQIVICRPNSRGGRRPGGVVWEIMTGWKGWEIKLLLSELARSDARTKLLWKRFSLCCSSCWYQGN